MGALRWRPVRTNYKLDSDAQSALPAAQPSGEASLVKLGNTVDARKEENGGYDVESERAEAPSNRFPADRIDALSQCNGESLQQEEQKLKTLQAADRYRKQIFVE